MKAVNDHFSVREKLFGNTQIFLIHVHHNVFHLLSVRKLMQILVKLGRIAGWQNINDAFIKRRSENALIFAIFRVAFEFVNGQYFRQ